MNKVVQVNSWIILCFIYIPSLITRFLNQSDYEKIDHSTFSLLGSMWLTGCFSLWFWSVSISLLTKISHINSATLLLLKLSFLIPLVYLLLPISTSFWAFIFPINNLLSFLTFGFYDKLHLIALFSLIYPIHFIAKYLTIIEYRKTVNFGKYVLTFIYLLIVPLGILLVQSRIKKVLESHPLDQMDLGERK